jgi:outer membrane lipoprotein-sorting protein
MNIVSRILLVTASLWFAIPVFADDALWRSPIKSVGESAVLENIASSLQRNLVLRSDFVQTRTMSFLKKPLVTNGNFIYAKDRGLVWKLIEPYAAVYVVTRSGIFEYRGNAQEPVQAGGEQVFRQMGMIFAAIFTADIQELTKSFDVHFGGDENLWEIGLKPKKKMIGKLIDRIQVKGSDYVSSIVIHEQSEDTIGIEFAGMSNTPVELDQIELEYFEKH